MKNKRFDEIAVHLKTAKPALSVRMFTFADWVATKSFAYGLVSDYKDKHHLNQGRVDSIKSRLFLIRFVYSLV